MAAFAWRGLIVTSYACVARVFTSEVLESKTVSIII